MSLFASGVKRACAAAFISLSLGSPAREAPADTTTMIGVAGVPRSLAETRDYERIFSILAAHGVELFFPIFLYQEAPAPASLGFETDFVPPCRPDDPAFTALRANRIRMIVPVGLLYDRTKPLPPLDRDPLSALLACAGRNATFGVTSYDEPAHNGISPSATKALYDRIKTVAPDMPVLMVHAPLKIEPGGHDTEAARAAYLASVQQHSQHSDVVGFDTYPIPPSIAKVGAPGYGGAIVDERTAVKEYLAFIRRAAPGKDYLSVLQNFSYADQFSPEMLALFPRELRARARAPSEQELQAMATEAVNSGADMIIWYGAAYADSEDAPAWKGTLEVSARLRGLR